jgi:hypothetical protein
MGVGDKQNPMGKIKNVIFGAKMEGINITMIYMEK